MNLIARTADISLGGLQHQFGSKARIMAGVVETVYQGAIRLLSSDLPATDDPVERLRSYISRVLHIFEQNQILAINEIRLAMRSDAELKQTVAPLLKLYDRPAFAELVVLLRDVGLSASEAKAWRRLILATIGGLNLEWALNYRVDPKTSSEVLVRVLVDSMLQSIKPAKLRSSPKS